MDSGASEYGLLATPYVSLTPIKGLTIKSAFGLNARFRRTDSFNVNFFIDNLEQNQNNNATRIMMSLCATLAQEPRTQQLRVPTASLRWYLTWDV